MKSQQHDKPATTGSKSPQKNPSTRRQQGKKLKSRISFFLRTIEEADKKLSRIARGKIQQGGREKVS
jgi:hypothetical protein